MQGSCGNVLGAETTPHRALQPDLGRARRCGIRSRQGRNTTQRAAGALADGSRGRGALGSAEAGGNATGAGRAEKRRLGRELELAGSMDAFGLVNIG